MRFPHAETLVRLVVGLAAGWLLWLPFASTALAQAAEASAARLRVPVRIELLDAQRGAHISVDGKGVVLPADGRPARFRLYFDLPPADGEPSPWEIRFNRAAVNRIALASGQWRPPPQSYFHPKAHDGLFPMAFVQALPSSAEGAQVIEVTASSEQLATLRPKVVRMALGNEMDKRALAIAVALYSAVLVLSLVAISLFFGVRELAFLSFLVFMGSSLLLMLAMNGHAYTISWLRWMAPYGGRGINMATLLVCASGIAVARDYAGRRPDNRWLRWLPSVGAMSILGVALACLAGVLPDSLITQQLVTACWVAAALLSLVAFVSATLRKAWLGWPLLAAVIILGMTGTLFELSVRGMSGEFWGRFGYQIGLVFVGVVLVVSLIGRIADFRLKHEQERNARKASELRLHQQEAYAALTHHLRQHLADIAPKDMEWRAIQQAMARLIPLLELESATILLYRPGFDAVQITEPVTQTSRLAALVAANAATLRAMAQRQVGVPALPLERATERVGRTANTFAGVPLAASGGIGVALLERAGSRPFVEDELNLATRFGLLVQELVAEASANHSLRRAAELDVLTGVLNRNAIDAALVQAFRQAHRRQQPLAILFVDMDHFKAVNDGHGHACGDHCLRQLAAALQSSLQPGDKLGRYGGEEFMVILPGQDAERARQVGESLRELVEKVRVDWQGTQVALTLSVGVAVRQPHEHEPGPALERADRALYAAKHSGRNQVNMGR